LNKLVERLDSRDHVIVRVLEPFLLWTMHTAAGWKTGGGIPDRWCGAG